MQFPRGTRGSDTWLRDGQAPDVAIEVSVCVWHRQTEPREKGLDVEERADNNA